MNKKEKQLIHEFVNSPREEGSMERSFIDRSVSKTITCNGEKTNVCIRTVGNVLYVYGKPVLAIFPAHFSSGKKDIAFLSAFVYAPSALADGEDWPCPISDLFFCVEKALPDAEYDIIHTLDRQVYVPEGGVKEPEGQTREMFLRKWLDSALTDAADSVISKVRTLNGKEPGSRCHIDFMTARIKEYSKEVDKVWPEGNSSVAPIRTLAMYLKGVAEERLQAYANKAVEQDPKLLSSYMGYYDTSFATYRRRHNLAAEVYIKTRDLNYSCRHPFKLNNTCSSYATHPDEDIINATFIEYVVRKAFAVVVANMGEELDHYEKQFISPDNYEFPTDEKYLSKAVVNYCCSSRTEWSNYNMMRGTKAVVSIVRNSDTGKCEINCITTTRGAVIRTPAGIRIARKVGNAFLNDYKKVPNVHIDNYQVSRDRTTHNSLVVGCHTFTRHEVERTMRVLNMSDEELAQEYDHRAKLRHDQETKSITRADLERLPGYDKSLKEVSEIIRQARSGPNSYEIKRGRELVKRLSEITDLLNAIKELDDEAGMPHTEPMLIMLSNYTCELDAAKARLASAELDSFELDSAKLACIEEIDNNTQQ